MPGGAADIDIVVAPGTEEAVVDALLASDAPPATPSNVSGPGASGASGDGGDGGDVQGPGVQFGGLFGMPQCTVGVPPHTRKTHKGTKG